jgi:hypothetical protein
MSITMHNSASTTMRRTSLDQLEVTCSLSREKSVSALERMQSTKLMWCIKATTSATQDGIPVAAREVLAKLGESKEQVSKTKHIAQFRHAGLLFALWLERPG